MQLVKWIRGIKLITTAVASLLLTGGTWFQAARAQTAKVNSATPPSFREITDEAGRRVRLPQSIRRIVSLAPSLTETIYSLGLQDRLVGDTDFCDYPADAQKKRKVGGAINPNIETIVALRPDLVLVTKQLNRYETVRALDGLGIPSYATNPHTVEEIISSTEQLADVLGAPETGISLAAELQQRLNDLRQRLKGVKRSRVLFVVWPEPLLSVGENTFIADALREAGAISIVDSTQSWPQVSLEEVVRLQPEFLVFAASHFATSPRDLDALATKPGWSSMEAVRQRRFAVISDAVNRPAPRIVSAIEELARQLHPDVFQQKPRDSKGTTEKKEVPPAPKSPPNSSRSNSHDANLETPECGL